MKKKVNKLRRMYQQNDKKTIFVYLLLRFLIIVCLVRELMKGNIENALLCILSLVLFTVPYFLEKTFKIDFPGILERIVYVFIFSAEILGEINNFYGTIPYWDTILHTINGFLCASIGFSLVYLLNEKSDKIDLSPVFVALVSFCFSMTVGIAWEVFEYGMDKLFNTDMQKDEYLNTIQTVELDPLQANNVITIDTIDYTIVYDQNGNELQRIDGYLDIGLNDTMKDLIVNFIGATVFSIFGYLYIRNENKFQFVGGFMTKKKVLE